MNFSKTGVVLFLGFAAMVMGCTNRDKIDRKINYDEVYFDYTVTAEENDKNVTCLFQFKEGDAEGKALNIEPAQVELDGQLLESDSARLSGFFYEIQKSLDSFTGKHAIVLTTPDGKQYRNEFQFSPFTLEEELPAKTARKPFIMRLKNFPATQRSVRLLVLDTAFESSGFNDLVPVINGRIHIDQSILNTIRNGPVNLELYMEQEILLKQPTKAGGRISITYGMRREVELVD